MHSLTEELDRLPRAGLGIFPTPLCRLSGFTEPLYIKRDDLSGLGPGGNKLRSLEFLLGEALEKKRDLVIVSGPGQSNLCTLTAVSCAKLGLPCLLIHNCAVPETFSGNLLLNRLAGAESVFLGNISAEERRVRERDYAAEAEAGGRKPFLITNGASTGLGALGYAAAAAELAAQRNGGIPVNALFVPGGNGGVAAGLAYGNAFLEKPFRLFIISVEDEAALLRQNMERIIAEAETITGLPLPSPLDEHCEILDGYRGEGWGINTPESEAAVIDFPRREGIFIENIYTSKTAAAMMDCVRRGKTGGGACYLHTGGFGSLFAQEFTGLA
ncbi:MAG: pyridoxal-phosphate dependent enzyme [Treponema sp.]|nr:pyridoxal-phosphate dependent enzyme [Treponema sp.]